jgi:Tfp pilus assembly protein PilF
MLYRLGPATRLVIRVACTAAFTCVLVAGCRNDDPAALVQSARDYLAKGDYKAAIIQLKNVLQAQPKNSEARLLLGQSNLIVGDAAAAERNSAELASSVNRKRGRR